MTILVCVLKMYYSLRRLMSTQLGGHMITKEAAFTQYEILCIDTLEVYVWLLMKFVFLTYFLKLEMIICEVHNCFQDETNYQLVQ